MSEDKDKQAFEVWAAANFLDVSYTYDTERSRWVFFYPPTADLWRAWQAALKYARPAVPAEVEVPNTFKLPGESEEAWIDRITGAVPAEGGVRPAAEPQAPTAIVQPITEEQVDEYLEDYETEYDEGSYTPDDEERFRIKDAIMGLLADAHIKALHISVAQGRKPEPQAPTAVATDSKDSMREIERLIDEFGEARRTMERTSRGPVWVEAREALLTAIRAAVKP